MKPPAIRRFRCTGPSRRQERGVTMVLVAIAMVAIIAMAALSIDLIALYLAREEAQRSADAAALAAARVISLSGMTGDPNNSASSWQAICGGSGSPATQTATAVATQNAVGRAAADTVNVTYSAGGSSGSDCSSLPAAFGVNPMVTVQVTRASLPTFFSRIWGNTGNTVSATATAEAFNPSYSVSAGNQTTGTIIPVQPRCVKPWVVPNRDPQNPGPSRGGTYCDQTPQTDQTGQTGPPCETLVKTSNGSITNPGISLNGSNTNGVIGERFWLSPYCGHEGATCIPRGTTPSPLGNYYTATSQPYLEKPPSLQYLPGEAPVSPFPVAVPSCASSGSVYEEAIGGCDQSTVYQCGVQGSSSLKPNRVDMSENPGFFTNDTMNGVQCLIHEGDATDKQPDGQDELNPYGAPSAYPFQILAGRSSPLVTSGLRRGSPITSSNSIVSLPIYDDSTVTKINGSGTTNVTIVGFLQVFINSVDQWGNVDVTVLNVAGCSNGTGPDAVGTAVTGSSPVPIRLITPP
jgi:Flp pilus assembly protein TadG